MYLISSSKFLDPHPHPPCMSPISVLPVLRNVTNFMLSTINESPTELAPHRIRTKGPRDILYLFCLPSSSMLQCTKYLLGKQTNWNKFLPLEKFWGLEGWLKNESGTIKKKEFWSINLKIECYQTHSQNWRDWET